MVSVNVVINRKPEANASGFRLFFMHFSKRTKKITIL